MLHKHTCRCNNYKKENKMRKEHNTIIRTALFLYPGIQELSDVDKRDIMEFIAKLKIIVASCNDNIKKIISDKNFTEVNCLPSISIEEIDKVSSSHTYPKLRNPERVRICVIEYNGRKYEEIYKPICEQYRSNKLNISHLVGLKINTTCKKIHFVKSDTPNFDVVIETGLSDMSSLLISIMLDMFLYHYFEMSNDIHERRHFSEPKAKYIIKSNMGTEYGNIDDLQSVSYLPFSYAYIKHIDDFNESEENTNKIKEIIDAYFHMVIDTMSIAEIKLSKQHFIQNPNDLKSIPDLHRSIIEKAIKEIEKDNSTYILFINNKMCGDANGKSFHLIGDANIVEEWMHTNRELFSDYSIYKVSMGG